MALAVVALGSNLGDRTQFVARACAALVSVGQVVGRSRLFEAAPLGPAQPDYLNAVALVETALVPRAILDELLAIERRLGRVRGERWGPRTIDLDLVAVERQVVREPGLELPHPGVASRAFVLAPLCDVAPDWGFPDGRTARELLAALGDDARDGVRPLDTPWPAA